MVMQSRAWRIWVPPVEAAAWRASSAIEADRYDAVAAAPYCLAREADAGEVIAMGL